MKLNLVVVDLDGTLIHFDSFRKLVLKNIHHPIIFYLLLIRVFRLINASYFKERVTKVLINYDWTIKSLDAFCELIIQNIDKSVMEKLANNLSKDDKVILCSASPDIYVKEIAKKLGWCGYGSHLKSDSSNNEYMHLFGKNKMQFILDKFPQEQYHYKYSISDSKSDIFLLKQFEIWELLK